MTPFTQLPGNYPLDLTIPKHVERLPNVRSKLHAAIRESFEGAGIEILSPAFTELRGTLARA